MKMNERKGIQPRSKPSTVRLHTRWTVIRCLSTPHRKVGELQFQLIPFLPVFLLPSLPTSTLSLWCMLLPYGVHLAWYVWCGGGGWMSPVAQVCVILVPALSGYPPPVWHPPPGLSPGLACGGVLRPDLIA